jgi:predicted nucleic acid-binding protein
VSEFVVDASVAVKWFFSEIHEASALKLFRGRHTLLVPDVFFAEVGHALTKRLQRRETTMAVATGALEALGGMVFQIHPAHAIAPLALDVAARFQRSFYDGLYLAVALLRHCAVVTADGPLYRALEQGPLRSHVLWVADLA